MQEDYGRIETKIENFKEKLKYLQQIHSYNDTYHIWFEDYFGTINNLRMGTLPSFPIEWTEINSAWGYCVELLDALVRHMGCALQLYELIPAGVNSCIKRKKDNYIFQL